MILALAGGVGGAKLANGFAKILSPDQLLVVVNTGDDFEHFGFPISPDLDTVTYTLAGMSNTTAGWGLAGESWKFMNALERLGGEGWFRLGDQDLATHVMRAAWLSEGQSLSDVTAKITKRLGILHSIVPMSDQQVRTVVETEAGRMSFQIYFVREKCGPAIKNIYYKGATEADPSQAFMSALDREDIDAIVICPSNPLLSIAPILALREVRARLVSHNAPVVAVSPIIDGKAVKGPVAKIFEEIGLDASALGVARYYGDLLDGMVIDAKDSALATSISEVGPQILVTETLMRSTDEQIQLAREVMEFSQLLPRTDKTKIGNL